MSIGTRIREAVIRRVRMREDLKRRPNSSTVPPDWLAITHVTGGTAADYFVLVFLRDDSSPISWKAFESLKSAMDEAHAVTGVNHLDWKPCYAEITNEDGTISWERAKFEDSAVRVVSDRDVLGTNPPDSHSPSPLRSPAVTRRSVVGTGAPDQLADKYLELARRQRQLELAVSLLKAEVRVIMGLLEALPTTDQEHERFKTAIAGRLNCALTRLATSRYG